MGKYINETSKRMLKASFNDKCKGLEEDGAVSDPNNGSEFKENLVCVVDNGMFAAAGYCYSKQEFEYFWLGRGGRNWKWYVWDKVKEFSN